MDDAHQVYQVSARVVAPGVSRMAAAGKGAVVQADTSAGQGEALMSPAELLVSAFAACVLKNVERLSILQPFAYERASIEVEAEREERPPRLTRVRYRLEVVTDEPERRVDLLHRNIAKYGTIYNTVAAACDVSGEIVAVAPERVAAPAAQG